MFSHELPPIPNIFTNIPIFYREFSVSLTLRLSWLSVSRRPSHSTPSCPATSRLSYFTSSSPLSLPNRLRSPSCLARSVLNAIGARLGPWFAARLSAPRSSVEPVQTANTNATNFGYEIQLQLLDTLVFVITIVFLKPATTEPPRKTCHLRVIVAPTPPVLAPARAFQP